MVLLDEKVESQAESFVRKLKKLEERCTQDGNKKEEKVRRHAIRTHWILGKGEAPPMLKRVLQTRRTKEEIQKKTIEKWNRRGEGEGCRNREMPRIKWTEAPPILTATRLSEEQRRRGLSGI